MRIMKFTHIDVFDVDHDLPETTMRLPLSARPEDPLTISDTARDCLRQLLDLPVVKPFGFVQMGGVMVTAIAERQEVAS